MKITDVLKVCDVLCPNEYTEDEKLLWCDELGAILTREHSKSHRIESIVIEDGRYALPPDVEECDIDRIIAGNQLIKKSDAPSYGIVMAEKDKRIYLGGDGVSKDIKFLLRPAYKKIRKAELCGVEIATDGSKITVPCCPFEKGDALIIEFGDEECRASIRSIAPDADGTVSIDTDNTDLPQGVFCGDIKRVITDETVCSAPFDVMYFDFINAKICFYQRDFDSYNHHMALFNSRLEDYDRYMIKNTPTLKDNRVTNWWN